MLKPEGPWPCWGQGLCLTHHSECGVGVPVMVRADHFCFLLFGARVPKGSPSSGSQTKEEDPVLESAFPTVFQTGLWRSVDYILEVSLFEATTWKNK